MIPADHALLKVVQRGDEADTLLRQPAFASAVGDYAQAIVNQWAATDLHEKTKREDLYHQHVALQTVAQALASRVASGQRAREVLRDEAEEAEEYGDRFNISEAPDGLYEEAPQ